MAAFAVVGALMQDKVQNNADEACARTSSIGTLTSWQLLADNLLGDGDELDDEDEIECTRDSMGVSGSNAARPAPLHLRSPSFCSCAGVALSLADTAPITPKQHHLLYKEYRLLNEIGAGAFGRVCKARRLSDGKDVVVKEIKLTSLSDKLKAATSAEVQVLASFNHPNIVGYKDCFMDSSYINIVMEYCNAGDLSQFLKGRGGQLLAEDEVMFLFIQICLALQFIHAAGVTHRDLKTNNCMLSSPANVIQANASMGMYSGMPLVKLGDFGVAKVTGADASVASTVVGTPQYLCPEMIDNKPYGRKSDVWALGCILYELCSLSKAFHSDTIPVIFYKISQGKYDPLPESCSQELKDLTVRLLCKDPVDRPTVQEILNLPFVRLHLCLYLEWARSVPEAHPEVILASLGDSWARTGANGSGSGSGRLSAAGGPADKLLLSLPSAAARAGSGNSFVQAASPGSRWSTEGAGSGSSSPNVNSPRGAAAGGCGSPVAAARMASSSTTAAAAVTPAQAATGAALTTSSTSTKSIPAPAAVPAATPMAAPRTAATVPTASTAAQAAKAAAHSPGTAAGVPQARTPRESKLIPVSSTAATTADLLSVSSIAAANAAAALATAAASPQLRLSLEIWNPVPDRDSSSNSSNSCCVLAAPSAAGMANLSSTTPTAASPKPMLGPSKQQQQSVYHVACTSPRANQEAAVCVSAATASPRVTTQMSGTCCETDTVAAAAAAAAASKRTTQDVASRRTAGSQTAPPLQSLGDWLSGDMTLEQRLAQQQQLDAHDNRATTTDNEDDDAVVILSSAPTAAIDVVKPAGDSKQQQQLLQQQQHQQTPGVLPSEHASGNASKPMPSATSSPTGSGDVGGWMAGLPAESPAAATMQHYLAAQLRSPQAGSASNMAASNSASGRNSSSPLRSSSSAAGSMLDRGNSSSTGQLGRAVSTGSNLKGRQGQQALVDEQKELLRLFKVFKARLNTHTSGDRGQQSPLPRLSSSGSRLASSKSGHVQHTGSLVATRWATASEPHSL